MQTFFVFNGDADGLCGLQQLVLEEKPAAAELVTGMKRRTELVREVKAGAGDAVTVLDLSFQSNAAEVGRLLQAGARVRYFDHHHAGELPAHEGLEAHIDLAPDVCTSVLVDRYLKGAQRRWAVAGAFGDNLDEAARRLAGEALVPQDEVQLLARLGQALNYNAYGETEEDLLFHPRELHLKIRPYRDPAEFAVSDPAFARLWAGYQEDRAHAAVVKPAAVAGAAVLYVLPDAKWARRVNGVLANQLARTAPRRAHAVAVPTAGGTFMVSVRAPLERPKGAAALCLQFPSGGGREGAAGINALPAAELERFTAAFLAHFRA